MTWTVRIAKQAQKQLAKFPRKHQDVIRKHLRDMAEDLFRGDVQPIRSGTMQGRYRKVVGRYRVIFVPNHQDHLVEISAILPRNEKTYK